MEATAARAEDWLELPGKIEPFRDVTVSAEVGGLLEWLGADEGEAVSKGQKLVVIDRENLELKERQAELAIERARIGEAQALIGIGSVLLDHAVVGSNTLVAAGSVVLERTNLEPNSLYAGVPVKRIKTVDPKRFEVMNKRIAKDYVMYAEWYKEG